MARRRYKRSAWDGPRRGERQLIRPEPLEDRRLLAAVPVISEFMADNQGNLLDEDGQSSDWIELANWGDQPLALGGYSLTDNPENLTRWTLPARSLQPGEHLLIFASGKDRRDPGKTCHTNFSLARDGEFLALVHPDGRTIVDAFIPGYPGQVANVSYGRVAPEGTPGYFPVPTPGAANSQPPVQLGGAQVVINEIMYHPASGSTDEEFVELLNVSDGPVVLNGWRISGGIDVQLPNVTVPAGGTLVVAADPAVFESTYGAVSLLAGPWAGRLSNQGDTVTLRDSLDRVVDRVTYADEGDWAQRARGPLDNGHTGWVWLDLHDGGGRSLELVNPRLPNEYGGNWAASAADGGSPGRPNSRAAANTAPLIIDVSHDPPIPRAQDTVAVHAQVVDELTTGLDVRLHWRVDGTPDFVALAMRDDGAAGDRVAGDGVYYAELPAQPDRTVVEYYVEARDSGAQSRTWPAVTADAGQATNALYQVIDEFDAATVWQPGMPPTYFQIMTGAERQEFTNIHRRSRAQMNATFVSVTGAGIEVRHLAGVRIRGSGSRNETPPNNRINLPSDRPWQGVTALNLNRVGVANQIAGSLLFRLAGMPAAHATGVRLYSNGVNLLGNRFYAHLEVLDRDFADRHFPDDASGNLYRGRRANVSPPGGQGAGLAYLGPDPAAYASYTKLTNEGDADWSDVIRLTDVLNNAPDETYVQQLSELIDIDEWLRFFALNDLVSNSEGGLVNGDRQGDDYAMYRGIDDDRFRMIPHDLDSILSQVQRDILLATNVPALNRFLLHPEIRPRYYQTLLDLVDNVFQSDRTESLLRDALRHVTNEDEIGRILRFLDQRSDFIRELVTTGITVETHLPANDGRVVTTESELGMWGRADYRANSVLVNGQLADFDETDNTWSIGTQMATVLAWNSEWQYLDDGSDQGTAWYQPDFAPGPHWKTGQAELGYGDGNEATVIGFGRDANNRFITTYFRREFNVADPSRYSTLLLEIVRDDGAAVYLNGQRVAVSNLPTEGPIDYRTLALSDVTGAAENAVIFFELDPAMLVSGKNVLAVEVHQSSPDSSDVSFRARLRGRFHPPEAGAPLTPGVNDVIVQAMSGPDGTGEVLSTERLEVWLEREPQLVEGRLPRGEMVWSAAGGPYLVRGELIVGPDSRLVIEPGTSVYFEREAELVVQGSLTAVGRETARIRFTSDPRAAHVPDLPGLPDGPPRWKGIHFVNSHSPLNRIAFADVEYAQHEDGSIGVDDGSLQVEHVTFRGTHLHMIYADDASLVVRNSVFPDVFAPGEDPEALGLNNVAEQIEIDGLPPQGGQLIIQGNYFGTNRGHNDVIDANSHRFGEGPILQVLDNVFEGTGDELLDLGGDAYIAGNLFRGVRKDEWTRDRGYASAISTGDSFAGSLVVVTRNVFFDIDHAITLKNDAATIFEHNTVVQVHPDFVDRFGNTNVGAPLIMYIDEPGGTTGRGAYVAQNIFADMPRVFGGVDQPRGTTSNLQFHNNLLSPELATTGVGQRPGTILDLGSGNLAEDPRFIAPDELNFEVRPGSAATAPGRPVAWGASAPAGAWVSGRPNSPTSQRSAVLTVGGPGLFSFRYRVNGGPWSPEQPIGDGFDPRGTIRTGQITLTGLADGQYTVEVQGRDFAGNWQPTPTVVPTWTVHGDFSQVVLSEVLAVNQTTLNDRGARPDLIELHNAGATPVNLRGMSLSDDPDQPRKFVFQDDQVLPPGGYLTLFADDRTTSGLHTGFSLSREGEGVYLFRADGRPVDAVEFGMQVPDLSIGRIGSTGQWQLTVPTFGRVNEAARTGDPSNLRINEWLAQPASGDDFVELANLDPLPVDISGMWLSDAGDGMPAQHKIAPLSFIAGNGFALFHASGDATRGPDHLSFALDRHAETLQLSDSNLRVIDIVPYGPQTAGRSQGRLPDGAVAWAEFPLPSPGWPNGTSRPGDLTSDGVVDRMDVDLMCIGLRSPNPPALLDLNRDRQVNLADMQYLIQVLLGTNAGDANLDGVFNSQDLVQVFQAGQYEDSIEVNSSWATGDWDCDGEFGTADLVAAFQAGGYAAAAHPEAEVPSLASTGLRASLADIALAHWPTRRPRR